MSEILKRSSSFYEQGGTGAGEHGRVSSPLLLRSSAPLFLALAAFLLYLRTLAPDVVDSDGGEFQFAAWNFSFVHPTGYPLYLILGGLFQHLVPIGNPAYRLNLFTAINGALAVGALYILVDRMTRQRIAGVVAAASFGVTRTFWFDASGAEAYALHAFFIALLMILALRWQSEPDAKKFAMFCFVYGIALTHHRSIILWLPAFAIFFGIVVWRNHVSRFTFHVSRIMLYVLLFLAPLLLYLYVPLRASQSPYYSLTIASDQKIFLYDNSIQGFYDYLLGRVFQSEIGWDAASIARISSVPQLLLGEFGGIGAVLGALGFVAMLWKKEWARLALLSFGFAATVLFASIYHIGDISHYYIPAYLVWAIGIGVAVAWLFTNYEHLPSLRHCLRASVRAVQGLRITNYVLRFTLYVLLLLAIPVIQLITNYSFADRSHETQSREQWNQILAATIPTNAILISNDRDEMMPLWYIQYVENARRDILGLFPLIAPAPEYANVVRLTDHVLDAGRPIYFVKPMPGIEIKFRVEPFQLPLVRVAGRAADASPRFSSKAVLAERVRVIGYDVSRVENTLQVAIYWQLKSKLARDYTTFAHLLSATGEKIAQGKDHQVGGEFYPTSLWDVGETLRDEHSIPLPRNISAGEYRVIVGMYHYPDLEMLGEPVESGVIDLK